MRRWHVLAVMAALVLSACLGSTNKNVKTLPTEHATCSSCHVFSSETGRAALQNGSSPDEICYGCHSDRTKTGEHRVGVPVNVETSPLPLVDGKVACITCHEPHGLSGFPSLLRTAPEALCNRCHEK